MANWETAWEEMVGSLPDHARVALTTLKGIDFKLCQSMFRSGYSAGNIDGARKLSKAIKEDVLSGNAGE